MTSEFTVVDAESGEILDGEPSADLVARNGGPAWWSPGNPGTWHPVEAGGPAGMPYRTVLIIGPDGDPNYYENTVENLETSEGG